MLKKHFVNKHMSNSPTTTSPNLLGKGPAPPNIPVSATLTTDAISMLHMLNTATAAAAAAGNTAGSEGKDQAESLLASLPNFVATSVATGGNSPAPEASW
eukprot:sb/3478784/